MNGRMDKTGTVREWLIDRGFDIKLTQGAEVCAFIYISKTSACGISSTFSITGSALGSVAARIEGRAVTSPMNVAESFMTVRFKISRLVENAAGGRPCY